MNMALLTNQQMIAGRFLRLAKGKKRLMKMHATWEAGGFVRVGNHLRYSDYYAKHKDYIVMDKEGSLYDVSRKKAVCLDFCHFRFAAPN